MILPRLLTAVVGIPVVLCMIHLGRLPFAFFVAGAAALALYEYALVIAWARREKPALWTAPAGFLLVLLQQIAPDQLPLFLSASMGLCAAREIFRSAQSAERMALEFFGLIFIAWNLSYLILLRDLAPHGRTLTYLLFALIWVNDSAAQGCGKLFGNHPLTPLSPKKTWEGAAGGLAACVAASVVFCGVFLKETLSPADALAIGLLTGVFGQLSDLSESAVKRFARVKDSSDILPGHGGVLDRFDSLILTAPVLYYCLGWFLRP